MNRIITTGLMALAFAGLAAGAAQAETITYKISGVGSWTLDGVAQRGAFTVTLVGDTTGVFNDAGTLFNNATDFTFDLNGTSYGFTGSTGYVFDDPSGTGAVGFGGVDDFLDLTNNPAFTTYGLTTNLSPALGDFRDADPQFAPTTGGDLIFTSADALEFSAVVPEPAAWALMLTGIGGLGAMLRSRRKLATA
jgi:hypothetical protein